MPILTQDRYIAEVTTNQFKALILPLRDKLFRFALSYVKDADEAKDVVQDVMIKSWEEIEKPSTINNIEAWCITLCRNKSLDKLKRKGRHYMQIVDRYDLQADTKDPLETTLEKETGDTIREIISHLSQKQKEVITLRDIEGHTYKEVAEIVGVELSNVKVLLHRARMTVREELKKRNDYGIDRAL